MNKQNNREGIPMSEESVKEWRKSFSDIEESIEAFYKKEKKKQKKKQSNS